MIAVLALDTIYEPKLRVDESETPRTYRSSLTVVGISQKLRIIEKLTLSRRDETSLHFRSIELNKIIISLVRHGLELFVTTKRFTLRVFIFIPAIH